MRSTRPRALILLDHVAKDGIDRAVANDAHPRMDYHALREATGADLFDFASVRNASCPFVVRVARVFGATAALAALAYCHRAEYDVVFSMAERISIPLALMFKGAAARPRHVMLGHRLSAPKKRLLLQQARSEIDAVCVYASPQARYAVEDLGIAESKVHLIPFHADDRFYRPVAPSPEPMICSAGLEWRDYPTMIAAMRGLPIDARLGTYSPLSRKRNEIEGWELPGNVTAGRYEFAELRALYARSRFVVVPLHETDFQAGITTVLEAMAMRRAVIVSRTAGQRDTVRDGVTGLYVPPGDVEALRAAVVHLLAHPEEALAMGARGRQHLESQMTLDHWVTRLSDVMFAASARAPQRLAA